MENSSQVLREVLQALGVDRFVLGLHAAAFPGANAWDLGRGTPYASASARLLELAAGLGFNGLQLGPLGLTEAGNPSPYDSTAFSRNPLDVDLTELMEAGLVDRASLEEAAAWRPAGALDRVAYDYAFRTQHGLLDSAYDAHGDRLRGEVEAFVRAQAEWLEPDALFEVLVQAHGGHPDARWGEDRLLWTDRPGAQPRRDGLRAAHADAVRRYAFKQLWVHRQHARFQQRAAAQGLTLFGDLQIGLSARDVWRASRFLLEGYALGAPPSRTNPEGQAWNYPVLDPAATADEEGLAGARFAKMLSEFDGVRIDHPHGLVTPWVYRLDADDLLASVRGGARLLCSPDLPDHPRLAAYAIARPDQLERSLPRYADGWVRTLDEAQVDRYARGFELLVASMRQRGRDPSLLVCEVLSTLPYPLARVLQRYGLGRFRVTQKANLSDPEDVYRSENAAAPDWVMLGNHDTAPIWAVVKGWQRTGRDAQQAEYLAQKLVGAADVPLARGALQASPTLMAHAMLADALLSPARNVFVYFTDLFGFEAPYNVPGTVSPENWSLRVPPDFAQRHPAQAATLQALNVPLALLMALRARGGEAPTGLLNALEKVARSACAQAPALARFGA